MTRRASGRLRRMPQIRLISRSTVEIARPAVTAINAIETPVKRAACSAKLSTYSWTTEAVLLGSMFLKTNASRAANQRSKMGKRATNASATVAIGTIASSVVNERLLAVRVRPMSRIRSATRQTKRNGFKATFAEGGTEAGAPTRWIARVVDRRRDYRRTPRAARRRRKLAA